MRQNTVDVHNIIVLSNINAKKAARYESKHKTPHYRDNVSEDIIYQGDLNKQYEDTGAKYQFGFQKCT